MPIGGEEHAVELPAGKVKLRYVEDREGRSTEHGSTQWSGPEKDLAVIVLLDGDEVAIKKPRMIGEGAGGGSIYKELGSIQIEHPAGCAVEATMTVDPNLHLNPRIVFRA